MSSNDFTADNFISRIVGNTYSHSKCVDFLKIIDTLPTGQKQIGFRDAITGKRVIIGYNTQINNVKL